MITSFLDIVIPHCNKKYVLHDILTDQKAEIKII